MIETVLSDFSYVLATPKVNGWEINQKLLDYYQQLKNRGLKIYLFTASQAYELPEIKTKLEPVIDQVYNSKQLKLSKAEPQSYFKLAELMNQEAKKIVFVDDQLVNVEAAREAGMNIVYFTTTDEAIKKITGFSLSQQPISPPGW